MLIILRRLPVVFAMHKWIHQIEEKRQAIFVGFFGPIGVSAIFYLYVSLVFLETINVDGVEREDAERLGETMMVVDWFLAICSIVSTTSSKLSVIADVGRLSTAFLFPLASLDSSYQGLSQERSHLRQPMNRNLFTPAIESETPQEVSSVSEGGDEVLQDRTRPPPVRLHRPTGIFIELAGRLSVRRIGEQRPLRLRLLTQ